MWSRAAKRFALPIALGTVGVAGVSASLLKESHNPVPELKAASTKVSLSSLLESAKPSMLMTMSSENYEDEIEAEEHQATVDAEDNLDEETLKNVYVETADHADLRIFGGTGNLMLAREIASHLGIQSGRARVRKYADGEIGVEIQDNVRGKDCFIVQSLCGNPQDQLMELLLMISTLRRASAGRIVAVLPYTAYVRQLDGSSYERTYLPAADIALMLETAGVDHVLTLDVHRSAFMGFFKHAVCENLDTFSSLLPYLLAKGIKQRQVSVVAPVGATNRATRLHDLLCRNDVDANLAFTYLVSKRGQVAGTSEHKLHHAQLERTSEDVNVVGDIAGRDVILVDDMIDSGSRVSATAEALKLQGAKNIYAYATHGLFTGNAVERIEEAPIREAIVFDTVPLEPAKQSADIRQLTVSGLIAENIQRIHTNKSTVNFTSCGAT